MERFRRDAKAYGFAPSATPWLSVVIPTCNGAGFVGRALDSVAAAGEEGVECVVVDDRSTDATRRIVRSYHERLAIRVEDGPGVGNWVASTNAGVRAARADHVTFLHQDDEWLPGRAGAVRALLRREGDAALVIHGARFLSSDGRVIGSWTIPLPGPTGVVDGDEVVERLLVQNFLCVGAPVFRRDRFLDLGGMDEDLWYTADWDLWLRLAATGRVAFDSRRLVGFRLHPASQTATRTADRRELRRQLETVLDSHLPGWAARTPRRAAGVERAARASIELNVALAGLSHGSVPDPRPLLAALTRLRPAGARRLARDSRLHQRVGARLRQGTSRNGSAVRLPSRPCR